MPESLAAHQHLILLPDGMNWPDGYDQPPVKWMTDEQQKAIWDFVHNGGGFLALHNAQGIYPPGCRFTRNLAATEKHKVAVCTFPGGLSPCW